MRAKSGGGGEISGHFCLRRQALDTPKSASSRVKGSGLSASGPLARDSTIR